jgi:hypothetical protein
VKESRGSLSVVTVHLLGSTPLPRGDLRLPGTPLQSITIPHQSPDRLDVTVDAAETDDFKFVRFSNVVLKYYKNARGGGLQFIIFVGAVHEIREPPKERSHPATLANIMIWEFQDIGHRDSASRLPYIASNVPDRTISTASRKLNPNLCMPSSPGTSR